MSTASDLHGEAPLREILDDPIVWAVMARDGVTEQLLEATISKARRAMTEARAAAGTWSVNRPSHGRFGSST